MRIDLHSHSTVSDGTQSPADVVRAAAAAGLDVLALTDHDSAGGWDEAVAAARDVGLTFVPGIEVSALLGGHSVHLLAYLPDPSYVPLARCLSDVLAAREARLPEMLARLREQGIELTLEDVRRVAPATAALGRPHVADALVAAGVVGSRSEGMRQYLSPGRAGWVRRYAADLEEVLDLVRGAGGVSVLAHPWGRGARQVLTPEVLARLKARGLVGVEVDHEDHSTALRRELRAVAVDLDLVVTGSSDHHGVGKVGHPLGCNTTDPVEYERLLAARGSASSEGLEPLQDPRGDDPGETHDGLVGHPGD